MRTSARATARRAPRIVFNSDGRKAGLTLAMRVGRHRRMRKLLPRRPHVGCRGAGRPAHPDVGGAHGCRGRRGRHGGPGADRRFSADARRGRAGRVGSAYGYGILPDHDTGLWCNATPEMLRAGAMAYFSQGAACTYLFNYDCQRLHGLGKPYSHGELQALREIGDAAALARLNKRHTVTVDGSASVEEGAAQEPPDLLRMGRNELTITVTKRREDADPLLITGIEVLINNDGGE